MAETCADGLSQRDAAPTCRYPDHTPAPPQAPHSCQPPPLPVPAQPPPLPAQPHPFLPTPTPSPIHPSPLPGGRLGGGWEATCQHHQPRRTLIVREPQLPPTVLPSHRRTKVRSMPTSPPTQPRTPSTTIHAGSPPNNPEQIRTNLNKPERPRTLRPDREASRITQNPPDQKKPEQARASASPYSCLPPPCPRLLPVIPAQAGMAEAWTRPERGAARERT